MQCFGISWSKRISKQCRAYKQQIGLSKQYAGEKYTGEAGYVNKHAVRDGNIVTANGTAPLDFCREILYALDADTPKVIEESYQFYTNGLSPR